jgi:hypothetical protein
MLVIFSVGFWFPWAWGILALMGVWQLVAHKPARAMVIKNDLRKMIQAGKTLERLNLNFTDAKKYVLEIGGSFDGYVARADFILNGVKTPVEFTECNGRERGTWARILANTATDAEEIFHL